MPQIVEVVKWREKRGEGWSETLYRGMRFDAPKGWILVSRLSHGLRAMYLADGMERKFEGETHQVSISDGFYNEIQAALQVDKKFQERLIEYEALMSDHQ